MKSKIIPLLLVLFCLGVAQATPYTLSGTFTFNQDPSLVKTDTFTLSITKDTSGGWLALSGISFALGGLDDGTLFFDAVTGKPGYWFGSQAPSSVTSGTILSETFSADGVSPLTVNTRLSGLRGPGSYTIQRDVDRKHGGTTTDVCVVCNIVTVASWTAGTFELALTPILSGLQPAGYSIASVGPLSLSAPTFTLTSANVLQQTSYQWSLTTDVVPEPGTYALLGGGLAALALLHRRRRQLPR